MANCSCGNQKEYSECCEPYIKGKSIPKTAEALMRARYSAFVHHEFDYIFKTHHKSTLTDLDREGVKTWGLESKWLGLEVIASDKGKEKDTEGTVEFRCKFILKDAEQSHHELSSFIKENGEWYFMDGVLRNNTIQRTSAKVGRNDPCPCGSGKKYKKCCG
jgi:SEC-C motif-containing protein